MAAGLPYVKRSCGPGQRVLAWDAVHPRAPAWVVTVAAQRLQGPTCRTAAEAFPDEPRGAQRGRPPAGRQPRLGRPVARECLVLGETNRASGPAAEVGQRVAVPWGPGETVPLAPRGPRMAPQRRVRGRHAGGVEPAPEAARRRPTPSPRAAPGDEGRRLARWTGPVPAVAGRPLAWYEALVR